MERAVAVATLQLCDITKTYDGTPAVHGVELNVRDGEFLSILGPSGCGKSTLLKLIAKLEQPDGGDVRIDGHSVTALDPRAAQYRDGVSELRPLPAPYGAPKHLCAPGNAAAQRHRAPAASGAYLAKKPSDPPRDKS